MRVGGQLHAPAALPSGKKPGTHCVGGWVGPRAGLDGWGKSPPPPPEFDSRTVQPVASRYTGYAKRPTVINWKPNKWRRVKSNRDMFLTESMFSLPASPKVYREQGLGRDLYGSRVGLLTREDGTDSWSRNVGKQLPHDASYYPRRAQISSTSRRKP
jgi:hypothetical protein